jgi:AAA+ ATPase superfamily predicted ATPase
MKFYDRVKEVEILRRIRDDSRLSARFTVLTGRRRVGKTELLKHAYGDEGFLYFFVARRSEAELCENYVQEIGEKLNVPIPGRFSRVCEVVRFVMELAKEREITLVIDEFQELHRIDPGAYSSLQRDWDLLHDRIRLNLVVSGSVNRMMNRIFRDHSEPLYGRQTDFLKLHAFSTDTLKEILSDCNPKWRNEDLLALYSFTGGVAKYVELLMDAKAFTRDAMLKVIFREESAFLNEGRLCLGDEFGRDYGTYFSILSAIARGHTTRPKIESDIGIDIGGYLKNLTEEYELLSRRLPLFDRPRSKNIAYALNDNFFIFWFRFIARYSHMLEIGSHGLLVEIVKRDYESFSGLMLERYFRQRYCERGEFTRIGSWWDRKGENEIDIIAANEIEKEVEFIEVKRNASKISLPSLESKAQAFLCATGELADCKRRYLGLSLEDM